MLTNRFKGLTVGEGRSFLSFSQRTVWLCAIAMAAAVGVASPAFGQCMYEVTIIRAPLCPGGGVPEQPGTVATDISDNGVIVGWHRQCADISKREAFRWTQETGLVTLPRPAGFNEAQALAVSDDGNYIVGQMIKQAGPEPRTVAFIYLNGQMINLGALPGHHHSYPTGLIDNSYVVGQSNNVLAGPLKAVRWMNQVIQELPSDDPDYSGATDVNDVALTVGSVGVLGQDSSAALWDGNVFCKLASPPKAPAAAAMCINNTNVIGGRANIADGSAFPPSNPAIWASTVPQLLPMLPDSTAGWVTDVSDGQQPIGLCRDQNTVAIGTIWLNGSAVNLNDVVVANPNVILVEAANATANNGNIVATIRTLINGVSGVVTGLLTPVESAPSDLNHDCVVNIFDLFLLLGEWNNNNSFADIDESGIVDVFDLFALLGAWS